MLHYDSSIENKNLSKIAKIINSDSIKRFQYIIFFTNAGLGNDTIGAKVYPYDKNNGQNFKAYALDKNGYYHEFLLTFKNNKVDKIFKGIIPNVEFRFD